jgi:hypothetical protein
LVYLALALTGPVCASAQTKPDAAPWTALRSADLRLASIVYRLALANNDLCDMHQAATGLLVQTLDQFPDAMRASAKAAFRFETPVTVEAVIAESPADFAGILEDDGLAKINDVSLAIAPQITTVSSTSRDQAEMLLAALRRDKPALVALVRHGATIIKQLVPRESCRVHAELVTDSDFGAQSDEQTLQVGIDYLVRFDDQELAAVAAHELAHIILRHTERLEAIGIHHGLLQEFGRNACTIRQAESEADRYSLWLLANAGFDPALGPKFWRGRGRSISGGVFRSATHDSAKRRAEAMEAELMIIKANAMHMPTGTNARFKGQLGAHCP